MTLDLKTTSTLARVRLLNWNWDTRVHSIPHRSLVGQCDVTNLVMPAGTHQGWEDWPQLHGALSQVHWFIQLGQQRVCIAEWEVYGTRPPRRSRCRWAPGVAYGNGRWDVGGGRQCAAGGVGPMAGPSRAGATGNAESPDDCGTADDASYTANFAVLLPLTARTNVNVQAGSQGRFYVKLSVKPAGNTTVNVARSSAPPTHGLQHQHADLHAANWSAWQQ